MKLNMEMRSSYEVRALPQLGDLYRTALYVSDNEVEAQDIVMKSYLGAFREWVKYQDSGKVRVWLFRNMTTMLGDKYRLSPDLADGVEGSERMDEYSTPYRIELDLSREESDQHPFSTISRDDITSAIANLADDYRLIVVLSLLQGFSYQEIAEITCLPIKAVRFRLHQGRRLLQRGLFDLDGCDSNYGMTAGRVRSTRMG